MPIGSLTMWQSFGPKKKDPKKNKKPKIRLNTKRIEAELKLTNDLDKAKVNPIRMILNDLRVEGVHVFAADPVLMEAEVSITFTYPKQFYARGKVVSCANIGVESKIITDKPVRYRIGIQFSYDGDEDKKATEDFINELRDDLGPEKIPA